MSDDTCPVGQCLSGDKCCRAAGSTPSWFCCVPSATCGPAGCILDNGSIPTAPKDDGLDMQRVAAVIGITVGILLVAIIVYVLYRFRLRKKKERDAEFVATKILREHKQNLRQTKYEMRQRQFTVGSRVCDIDAELETMAELGADVLVVPNDLYVDDPDLMPEVEPPGASAPAAESNSPVPASPVGILRSGSPQGSLGRTISNKSL